MSDEEKKEGMAPSGASRTFALYEKISKSDEKEAERLMAIQKDIFDLELRIMHTITEKKKEIEEDYRAKDLNHHNLRKEVLDRVTSIETTVAAHVEQLNKDPDKAESFYELVLNPKLLKEYFATLVAIAAMGVALWKPAPAEEDEKPEKNKVEKVETEKVGD